MSERTMERPRSRWTAEQWNERYPVGTPVEYRAAWGVHEPTLTTRTRSEAWTLPHGEPTVKIEGRAGGVALWALTPIPEVPTDPTSAPREGARAERLAWQALPDATDLKCCPTPGCGEIVLEGETTCPRCGAEPEDDARWREARAEGVEADHAGVQRFAARIVSGEVASWQATVPGNLELLAAEVVQLVAHVRAVEAERDHYREALEEISVQRQHIDCHRDAEVAYRMADIADDTLATPEAP